EYCKPPASQKYFAWSRRRTQIELYARPTSCCRQAYLRPGSSAWWFREKERTNGTSELPEMQHDDSARWIPSVGDCCIHLPFSRWATRIACGSNTDALPQLRLHLAGVSRRSRLLTFCTGVGRRCCPASLEARSRWRICLPDGRRSHGCE